MSRKNFHAKHGGSCLHGRACGGSITVKRPEAYNETATPVNGIMGLSSKPMVNNVAGAIKPVGASGPINLTGNNINLQGSGLKNISFSGKKKISKAKLKIN
jgi:hypothetical protein